MTQNRTYRRTAGTRIVSAGCAFLFVAGTLSVGATSGLGMGFFVLSGQAILSLANALGAWADRYTLGAAGLEYRNALLALFGARPRLVPWEDVVEVREHRSLRFGRLEPQASALFLVLRSGRRVVLDSLQDFETLKTAIQLYCGPRQ